MGPPNPGSFRRPGGVGWNGHGCACEGGSLSRIGTLLLAGFLVGALFIVPNPRGVNPEDEVTPLPPAFAVCLVQEGGGRTTEITTGTFDPGPLQTTLFSGGRVVGSIGATLD